MSQSIEPITRTICQLVWRRKWDRIFAEKPNLPLEISHRKYLGRSKEPVHSPTIIRFLFYLKLASRSIVLLASSLNAADFFLISARPFSTMGIFRLVYNRERVIMDQSILRIRTSLYCQRKYATRSADRLSRHTSYTLKNNSLAECDICDCRLAT